jgi:hypothetical protein
MERVHPEHASDHCESTQNGANVTQNQRGVTPDKQHRYGFRDMPMARAELAAQLSSNTDSLTQSG